MLAYCGAVYYRCSQSHKRRQPKSTYRGPAEPCLWIVIAAKKSSHSSDPLVTPVCRCGQRSILSVLQFLLVQQRQKMDGIFVHISSVLPDPLISVQRVAHLARPPVCSRNASGYLSFSAALDVVLPCTHADWRPLRCPRRRLRAVARDFSCSLNRMLLF